MKRTPLKRKTPLKPGEGPKRKTPMARGYRGKSIGEKVRSLIRARGCALRDRGECWGALHVHHIRMRSLGGTDDEDNLACLCARHHDWVHLHPTEAEALGLLRGPAAP